MFSVFVDDQSNVQYYSLQLSIFLSARPKPQITTNDFYLLQAAIHLDI